MQIYPRLLDHECKNNYLGRGRNTYQVIQRCFYGGNYTPYYQYYSTRLTTAGESNSQRSESVPRRPASSSRYDKLAEREFQAPRSCRAQRGLDHAAFSPMYGLPVLCTLSVYEKSLVTAHSRVMGSTPQSDDDSQDV